MYPQTVPYPIKVKTNQLVKLKHIETFRLVYISVSYRYFRHFATFSTRIPLDPMVVYIRADTLRTLPCWNKKITRDSAQDVSGGCVHKKLRLLATFSVCCPLASSVRKVTMTVHACAREPRRLTAKIFHDRPFLTLVSIKILQVIRWILYSGWNSSNKVTSWKTHVYIVIFFILDEKNIKVSVFWCVD